MADESEEHEGNVRARPRETGGRLFLRFLRFGALAWGGPVAQIDMIRHELVTEERWVTPEEFRRIVAIYQVLPGPEAHEICVHFGVLAGGRWGGVWAGLGFMLPGFLLMLALAWLCLGAGLATAAAGAAVFAGIQPAVIALIVRAVHRIGVHTLTDAALVVAAAGAAASAAAGMSFYWVLPLAGTGYALWVRGRRGGAIAVAAAWLALGAAGPWLERTWGGRTADVVLTARPGEAEARGGAGVAALGAAGLRTGLLTFGGAYTAIPFLRADAVERGQWMTEREFLDGVALAGVLPAPLIIFATYVGFAGGGWAGALAMTAGVFLPAFGFGLLFFRQLEKAMAYPPLKDLLAGVTAGVVGLIAVTAWELGRAAIGDGRSAAIAAAALATVWFWKSRWAVPAVIAAAGLAGGLLR